MDINCKQISLLLILCFLACVTSTVGLLNLDDKNDKGKKAHKDVMQTIKNMIMLFWSNIICDARKGSKNQSTDLVVHTHLDKKSGD